VLITERFLKGNARPVILSGFVLVAIFIYLFSILAVASNYEVLRIYVYAISFFLGFIGVQALGYIAKYYPKHIIGTISGLIIGINILLGSTMLAIIYAYMKTGKYHMSFNLMVAISVIGAIIAIFLKPVKEN
jgi:hypothetical protein